MEGAELDNRRSLSSQERESRGVRLVWRFGTVIPWSLTGTCVATSLCYFSV